MIRLLVLAALVAQSPAADSLRLLARGMPEYGLVAEARSRPLAVREAVAESFVQAVRSPWRAEEEIAVARRLAGAHAAAWADSFLVREVSRFAGWPSARRIAKVGADSIRKVGVAAYGRDGPGAAIRIWRRALARSVGIPDTAGVAAALGNIGTALVDETALDSAGVYLERARVLASRIGDVRVEANAIGGLGDLSERRGDLSTARDHYTRALLLRQRIGDTGGIAATHNNLGLLAQAAGDLDDARRQFEAALVLNRRQARDEGAATNLVNLAGLAALDGDFARAGGLYQNSLAIWRSRDRWADAASAWHGLGQLEIRRGDYPAAFESLREALAIYQRTGPLADLLAVQRDLAGALAESGQLQDAVDLLARGQRMADSSGVDPGSRGRLALARADLAVRLNGLAEAERLYRKAEVWYQEAGDAAGRADAQHGLGMMFLERDNYPRAQDLLGAALRTQLGAGNRRAAALTRISLGQLAVKRGATVAARAEFTRAAVELDRLGDRVAAAAALGERAELAGTQPAVAESLYRAGLDRVRGLVAPEIASRLHAGLGLVRRARGAPDEAARELRAAIAEFERPGQSLALAERRTGFLADKLEVYAELALTERGRNRPGAAFEASERLRAREMLELLARGRVAVSPDTAADVVGREQDLRRRIGELTRELGSPGPSPESLRGPNMALASGVVRDRLMLAQEAYTELLLEMRERAPRHAALVSPAPVSSREVARRLGADQALIEYLVSDSTSLAFLVTRDTLAVVDLGLGRRDLARLVEFARGTLERPGATPGDSLWRAPLRRLYQHLIAPIEETGLLAGKSRLVVVPHAELNYLPFATLISQETGRYLVERYEVTITPSASVWAALGERPVGRRGSGLLVLAPRPDALPGSKQEVAAIQRLARGNVQVRSGKAATEEAFRREASAAGIIHLATYGVLNRQNPLFSFIQLAPGGSHDGRLEVHEVFGLRLTAELVVLSACQTGLASGAQADVPAGDDWVGLTRAFLHAGAANVMATLWPVEDWATAALMEWFYRDLVPGDDPGRILAQAQRAMLASPATAHPFQWAGFVAVGGGR